MEGNGADANDGIVPKVSRDARAEMENEEDGTEAGSFVLMKPVKHGLRRRLSMALRRLVKQDSAKQRAESEKKNDDDDETPFDPFLQGSTEERFALCIDKIHSGTPSEQQSATSLLSSIQYSYRYRMHRNRMIAELIDSGVVEALCGFLKRYYEPNLQLSAVKLLTAISSYKPELRNEEESQEPHTTMSVLPAWSVIDNGAIPYLVELLSTSESADMCEEVCKCLGCIAEKGTDLRDIVLEAGALKHVLDCIWPDRSETSSSLVRRSAWALMCLCSGSSPPAFEKMEPALLTLRMLLTHEDATLKEFATKTIKLLSSKDSQEYVQSIFDAQIVPRLIEIIKEFRSNPPSNFLRVVHIEYAVQSIFNLVKLGNPTQLTWLLENGVWDPLVNIIAPESDSERPIDNIGVRTSAVLTIAKFTHKSQDMVQHVIDSGLLIRLINQMAKEEESHEMKSQMCWIIHDAIQYGSIYQINQIVDLGALYPVAVLIKELARNLQDETIMAQAQVPLAIFEAIVSAGSTPEMLTEEGENGFGEVLMSLPFWEVLFELATTGENPIPAYLVMSVHGGN